MEKFTNHNIFKVFKKVLKMYGQDIILGSDGWKILENELKKYREISISRTCNPCTLCTLKKCHIDNEIKERIKCQHERNLELDIYCLLSQHWINKNICNNICNDYKKRSN